MLNTLLLTALFHGSIATPDCDELLRAVQQVAEYQALYKAPFNMMAVRWTPARYGAEENLLLARSQNGPYGVPTQVPMLALGDSESSPSRLVHAAAERLIYEYDEGRHRLEETLAKKMAASIRSALKSKDFRSIWYAIHSPTFADPSTQIAATLRIYDASAQPFDTRRRAPLENWLDWTYPERRSDDPIALIDLQFAFQNSAWQLRDLAALQHLLNEVGTYIDMFYLSKGIPALIRLITTDNRARLFQNLKVYGFSVDHSAPTAQSHLMVMKMPGEAFVQKFGSRWPIWKKIYGLEEGPQNPLFDRRPLEERIQRELESSRRHYERLQAQLQQGGVVSMGPSEPPISSIQEIPTLWHYLDGLFEAILDSKRVHLLF